MHPAKQDHYAILGVAPGSDENEIRAAYRARARELHPDLGGSAAQMTLLNNSYEVLSDPDARRQYDAERQTINSEPGPFLPHSSESCKIRMGPSWRHTRTIWRVALGADCCLFLGLYCVLVTQDPEVSRSSVRLSITILGAILFLLGAVAFLCRYYRITRQDSASASPSIRRSERSKM